MTSLKSFWLIVVVLSTVSKICYGITCEFYFKDFKKLGIHTWRRPARVENRERISGTSSVGNNASNVNLSNFLVPLNCKVDKRNNDFDPHEDEKKMVCLNVIVVESLH